MGRGEGGPLPSQRHSLRPRVARRRNWTPRMQRWLAHIDYLKDLSQGGV